MHLISVIRSFYRFDDRSGIQVDALQLVDHEPYDQRHRDQETEDSKDGIFFSTLFMAFSVLEKTGRF